MFISDITTLHVSNRSVLKMCVNVIDSTLNLVKIHTDVKYNLYEMFNP